MNDIKSQLIAGSEFKTKANRPHKRPIKGKARTVEFIRWRRKQNASGLKKIKAEIKKNRKQGSSCKRWFRFVSGLKISQAKTQPRQSDWRRDLRIEHKSGVHTGHSKNPFGYKPTEYKAEDGFRPSGSFSRVCGKEYNSHQAQVWKAEISYLCRGK